jgi:hypothetical protein
MWPGNADVLVGLLLADADVGAPRCVLLTVNGMSVPMWPLLTPPNYGPSSYS